MPNPDLEAVLAIAGGLLLLAVPALLRRRIEDGRANRIAELEAGAEEEYFEEKRALQAYPSPSLETLRAAGLVLLSLGLAALRTRYTG